MKKRAKTLTTGLLSLAMIAPNVAYVSADNIKNDNINIDLEKRTVVLGDKSKVSISFKEEYDAETITLNYLCYDMQLSTILTYNSETNAYEGVINFNKDPEYLNVWEIENITINNEENPKVLNSSELQNLGLNVEEYKVTQEYIVENIEAMSTYMQKTSAPIKKLIGEERQDTAIEISKEGWPEGSNKVIVVNGDAISDGITATPLATTYDAPILLCNKDGITDETIQEIKRLSPEEIIVVGGTSVVSDKGLEYIENTTNKSVRRLAGNDRLETSLKIAQEIDDNHDVNKLYIANGYNGEVDALTIAAKAGEDMQPIILTNKDELTKSSYSWLKNENLEDAYFIGGTHVISTSVIEQVDKITSNSVYSNRVYGSDRHETNAKVLEKFYTQEKLEAVLVAKSDILVDALAAGPLAAKLKSPILITPANYVSAYHESNLKAKTAGMVYQVGGGLRDSVMNDIAYKLSERTEGQTVVIDPGHGGSDSGAASGSILEKNYTLDTSLATAEYLRNNDIGVVLTRDSDVTKALKARTDLSNSISPDLLVSIHYNKYNTTAKGVEIYYKAADKNGGFTKTAATNVLNSILDKFSLSNRGIKTRTLDNGQDYYHMIRESKSPSILVECAFIDSPIDQSLLNSLEKRQQMGTQIGKGIEKTLK